MNTNLYAMVTRITAFAIAVQGAESTHPTTNELFHWTFEVAWSQTVFITHKFDG